MTLKFSSPASAMSFLELAITVLEQCRPDQTNLLQFQDLMY